MIFLSSILLTGTNDSQQERYNISTVQDGHEKFVVFGQTFRYESALSSDAQHGLAIRFSL